MDCMKTPPKILGKYRRLGRGQNPEELRVTVGEFNGIKYLDFRIWELARDGQWFPTTRGVSVRERECDDLADVIAKGGKLLVAENAARRGIARVVETKEDDIARDIPKMIPVSIGADRSVPPWENR